jgi:hypothetical protein
VKKVHRRITDPAPSPGARSAGAAARQRDMLGPEMLSRQRKARVLFGLSDVVLTALAFEAAYQTRLLLPFRHLFFILVPV